MLKQVHTAIVGDEAMGHIGLVKRVTVLEAENTAKNLNRAKQAGFITACGIFMTEGCRFLYHLINEK